MASINVVGLANSTKTPLVKLAVILGGAGTSVGESPKKILLIGNMIATALTGSAPSFTVSAGTWLASGAAKEEPVQVFSSDDAATKFGRGSELHRMALKVFEQYKAATLWCCPVAENGSNTKASATLTFVGSATAAGTIRLMIAGKQIDVGYASGDTVTTIATACATAIRDQGLDLPVTAQFAAGVLTVTARNGGPRGNDLAFRAYHVNGNDVIAIGTSTTANGTAATITGSGKLASGATADSATNALAAIANTKFDRIAVAFNDTTNIAAVGSQVDTMAAIDTMKWQQVIAGSIKSPSNATADAATLNKSRIQLVAAENCDATPGEMAAQVAAARLIGNAVTGGSVIGEATDPATNLDGCSLKSIPVQAAPGDIPTGTEIETMLNNGVTPLVPDPSNPGYLMICRSITTRHKNGSFFDYSVLDTSNVTVLDHAAETIQIDWSITFAACKLGVDAADGTPPKISKVVRPSDIKARTLYLLKSLESQGIVRNVDNHLSELQAVPHPTVVGRVDLEIPVEPIPGLHLIGGNVRQVG
jgi:phage tail sheath gpL-like